MRQREEKTAFIKRLTNEIRNRETLREVYNTVFLPMVAKFNGKVYNKRFDNALNEELKKVSPLMFAKCEQKSPSSYSNFKESWTVQVVLSCYNEKGNYSDKESLYTNVVLDCSDGYTLRINAEKSKEETYTIAWGDNFDKETAEEKEILTNYNKYLKVAQKVFDAIEVFKDLPYRFRQNIEINNSFYLNH